MTAYTRANSSAIVLTIVLLVIFVAGLAVFTS